MRITKYAHRYLISLSAAEMAALREIANRGKQDFTDETQFAPLLTQVRRILKSERWTAIRGPLSVDVDKSGRSDG